MDITISLYGDAASITTLGLFLAAIGTAVVAKVITIIWKMIPLLG